MQSACHPFSSKGLKHNYILVHNGWLTNAQELVDDHYVQGIKYRSQQADNRFNDSEALLYDVALYLDGKQDKLNAEGAIAFVVVERDGTKPIKLHFARNSSPLIMQFKPGRLLSLASEGHGEMIKPDTLYTFDYTTGKITTKALQIPEYRYQPQAGYKPTYKPSWRYDEWYNDDQLLLAKSNKYPDYTEEIGRHLFDGEETYGLSTSRMAIDYADDLVNKHGTLADALEDAYSARKENQRQIGELEKDDESADDDLFMLYNVEDLLDRAIPILEARLTADVVG